MLAVRDGAVTTLSGIQTRILDRLNSTYEEDFGTAVPDQEFCRIHSLTPQQLEVTISPLLAGGIVEKFGESLGGYNLRLTEFGKQELDRQVGNRENERVREKTLAFLSRVYEQNVHAISNSDDIAKQLDFDWNKLAFNLAILELQGCVELNELSGAGHAFYNVTLTPRGKYVHDNPPARLLFVSHAAVDEKLARLLKEAFEQVLPGIDTFVASDPEDLKPGDTWVEVILENLRKADLIIVLATQRGLSRKWVWYESGATWSRGVRVVPCCIGSLRKGELPAPFSTFQALNIDELSDFQRLLRTATDELGMPQQEPFDIPALVQKLRETDQSIVASNPAFMPSDEIQRRLNSVELAVRLDQGVGEWFSLLVENQSTEDLEIEEMQLESKDGHSLTNPARPKPPTVWKLEPKPNGRLSIQCQLQPDPVVQLLTLYDWPKSNFSTDVNFRFLCRTLTMKKWCNRLLRVQVDRGARRIWQLVG